MIEDNPLVPYYTITCYANDISYMLTCLFLQFTRLIMVNKVFYKMIVMMIMVAVTMVTTVMEQHVQFLMMRVHQMMMMMYPIATKMMISCHQLLII